MPGGTASCFASKFYFVCTCWNIAPHYGFLAARRFEEKLRQLKTGLWFADYGVALFPEFKLLP